MLYRKEIDGLRAIAVLSVIFYHANLKIFSGGFVGVDIFFVISGYLITTLITIEKQEGRFTLINFYERRFRRILPALFFVMLSCLPLAWLWFLPKDMRDFSQSVAAVSAFSSNVYYWRTSGYFETASELKPLLHTWSLAVEEQYYLIFPIFFLFIWRLRESWKLTIFFIVAITSLGLAQWGASHHKEATFFLLPTRAWEFLVGTFISFILTKDKKLKFDESVSQFGAIVGTALITYSIFAFDSKTPFPSIYTLAPTFGAALLILFATEQTFVGKLLSAKPLVGIGLISYSAYLWHWPLFVFARQRNVDEPNKFLIGFLTFAALALAYLSWKYIERPFRDKKNFNRRTIFALSALATCCFFALGVAGHLREGYRNRFAPEVLVLNDGSSDKNPRQSECLTGGITFMAPGKSCAIGNSDNIVGALIGDSHADTISYPLSKSLSALNLGVKQMTYGGCAPSPTFFRGGEFRCREYNAQVREILNDSKYRNVIVMARWTIYLEGTGFDNGEGGIEPDIGYLWADGSVDHVDRDRALSVRKIAVAESFKKAIFDLLKSGKRVLLVYPVPEVGWDVPTYASKKLLYSNGRSVTTSHEKFLERNAAAIEALNSLGMHENLVRIQPEEILCNTSVKGRCITVSNGVSLYYDEDHLSNAGAELLTGEILKNIRQDKTATITALR